MKGPTILARTLSVPTSRGKSTREWQYHSRSDTHSKVACWTVLYDLLGQCDIFRQHAEAGRIAFGINHQIVGPINKTLDLVVTRPSPRASRAHQVSFIDLVDRYGIQLDDSDRQELALLPRIWAERSSRDISEVVIALEAKACMTEHSKSLPRLHAEILATGYLAKRAQPNCITVSYSMVNAARSFVTPSSSQRTNQHSQPGDASKVIEMLGRAVPRATDLPAIGYNVVGAIVVDCRNDGSPITLVSGAPAPDASSHINYEQMIFSLCSEYRARFGA